MYRYSVMLIPLIFLGLSPGCSRKTVQPYTVRREGGIRVLSYNSDIPPSTNPYTIGDPVSYGEGQSEGTYLFSSADFVGRFDDGIVLINDLREGRIHRFSAEGAWLGSFGQKGPGPHEFGTGYTPYIVDDHINVWVGSSMRLLRFDREGTYLGGRHSSFRMGAAPLPLTSDPQDGFFTVHRRVVTPRSVTTTSISYYTVIRVQPDLVQADTLFHQEKDIEGLYIGTAYSYQPYQVLFPPSAFSTDLPLAFGETELYRVEYIPVEGNDTLAVEIPVRSYPVPGEEKQRQIEYYARYGMEEAARRNLRFPDRLPMIRWMVWDGEDRLWVEDYQPIPDNEEGRHYNVFSTIGEWLMSQDLPGRPVAIYGDGFYMSEENEAGEPVVRFYPFTTGSSDPS